MGLTSHTRKIGIFILASLWTHTFICKIVKFYSYHKREGRGGPICNIGLLFIRPVGDSFEELTCAKSVFYIDMYICRMWHILVVMYKQ
jgi:hypothetical protein